MPEKELSAGDRAELAELRDTVRRQRMEIEILKKAAAWFARKVCEFASSRNWKKAIAACHALIVFLSAWPARYWACRRRGITHGRVVSRRVANAPMTS